MAIKRINCEILVDSDIWDIDSVCADILITLDEKFSKDEYSGIQIVYVEVEDDAD